MNCKDIIKIPIWTTYPYRYMFITITSEWDTMPYVSLHIFKKSEHLTNSFTKHCIKWSIVEKVKKKTLFYNGILDLHVGLSYSN